MPVFGYRPGVSRHILKSGYPVCISAVFNPSGALKPVAFGVVIEGMRYRYKIKDIKSVRDNYGVITFECEYEDFGRFKTVLLQFVINQHQWTVG